MSCGEPRDYYVVPCILVLLKDVLTKQKMPCIPTECYANVPTSWRLVNVYKAMS
jgi:hypothetical protein